MDFNCCLYQLYDIIKQLKDSISSSVRTNWEGNIPMSGTCFFIGHREAGEEVLPALTQAVERQIIQYGVTDFMAGHYGGFDRMAALTVQRAKRRDPHPPPPLPPLRPSYPDARGLRRHLLSSRHGTGAQALGHRPGKPLSGGPQRLSHRLRLAPCQQCPRTAGVRSPPGTKRPSPSGESGGLCPHSHSSIRNRCISPRFVIGFSM